MAEIGEDTFTANADQAARTFGVAIDIVNGIAPDIDAYGFASSSVTLTGAPMRCAI
jgi:hypothetical protein